MARLLLSTYTGYPSSNTGGPNKVIYQILTNLNLKKYSAKYLSKHAYFNVTSNRNLEGFIKSKLSLKKTFSIFISRKSKFYRSIVSHPIYLSYHFFNNNRYFKKINLSDFDPDIIHSHDVLSCYYTLDWPNSKKILTIHSKGTIVDDWRDYVSNSSLIKKNFEIFDRMETESFLS